MTEPLNNLARRQINEILVREERKAMQLVGPPLWTIVVCYAVLLVCCILCGVLWAWVAMVLR